MTSFIRYLLTILTALFCLTCETNAPSPAPPRHTILFILDGMAAGTLERLDLPALRQLKAEGVFYPEMELILPAHPDYNEAPQDPAYYPWGCSLPNIPLMTGSLFVGQDGLKENMIQHSFGETHTAFVVNDDAYEELRYGFDIYHRHGSTEADMYDYRSVTERAKAILTEHESAFLRIHFQGPGSAGYLDYTEGDRDIWAPGSHYRREMARADTVLGDFVRWLRETERLPETVLIVMGDHGQNDEGWHAPYTGQAQRQPVIITGKGIKEGKTYAYAEALDVSPTIASLHGLPVPAFSQGRVLREALQDGPDTIPPVRQLRRLNELLLAYHRLAETDSTAAANSDFLPLETIGSWHRRFDTLGELLTHQEAALPEAPKEAKPE